MDESSVPQRPAFVRVLADRGDSRAGSPALGPTSGEVARVARISCTPCRQRPRCAAFNRPVQTPFGQCRCTPSFTRGSSSNIVAGGGGGAQIDAVPIGVATKTEREACSVAPGKTLDGMSTLEHTARSRLRTTAVTSCTFCDVSCKRMEHQGGRPDNRGEGFFLQQQDVVRVKSSRKLKTG